MFSGLVIRLINIPTALSLAVCMSLVPAISSAWAVQDMDAVQRQTNLGLRFAFLIGLPCSVGMSVLSEQIFRFFYQGSLSEENIMTGSTLLMVSSLTVVLFTVVQATSSILQGVRKQRIPMYTLVAGVVCKIALNYTLVGIPGFNIHGAPISSLVCYTVSLVPNLYYVMKYTGTKFNWRDWLVRPGIATLAMGAAVCLMTRILPFSRLLTIVEVAVGVAVFVVTAIWTKALTKEDLNAFRRKRK